jgi:hypothetical protein
MKRSLASLSVAMAILLVVALITGLATTAFASVEIRGPTSVGMDEAVLTADIPDFFLTAKDRTAVAEETSWGGLNFVAWPTGYEVRALCGVYFSVDNFPGATARAPNTNDQGTGQAVLLEDAAIRSAMGTMATSGNDLPGAVARAPTTFSVEAQDATTAGEITVDEKATFSSDAGGTLVANDLIVVDGMFALARSEAMIADTYSAADTMTTATITGRNKLMTVAARVRAGPESSSFVVTGATEAGDNSMEEAVGFQEEPTPVARAGCSMNELADNYPNPFNHRTDDVDQMAVALGTTVSDVGMYFGT